MVLIRSREWGVERRRQHTAAYFSVALRRDFRFGQQSVAPAQNRRFPPPNHQSHFRRHDQQENYWLHGILHYPGTGRVLHLSVRSPVRSSILVKAGSTKTTLTITTTTTTTTAYWLSIVAAYFPLCSFCFFSLIRLQNLFVFFPKAELSVHSPSFPQIAEYVKQLRDSLWLDGVPIPAPPPRDAACKMRLRVLTKTKMLGSLPDDLKRFIGNDTSKRGSSLLLFTCISVILRRHMNDYSWLPLFP